MMVADPSRTYALEPWSYYLCTIQFANW